MPDQIIVAEQTRKAINKAIYDDQGRTYRGYLRDHILDVDDAYDSSIKDDFRTHLGISMSGRECARELYYKFRWANPTRIDGRLLRLFNRGHLEEARFVAALRTIGCQVWQAESVGKQFRVSYYGGHYGSAIDGVVQGIPEMPDTPLLAEMKTHNEKSFRKLAGETNRFGETVTLPQGVKLTKIEHYIQMQQYMGYYNLSFGLYCAVNKNDDDFYFEIVPYDRDCDMHFRERSRKIIFAKEAPPRLSENSSFWKCKNCDERGTCHNGKDPAFNCRTCAASIPHDDGTWWCLTHNQTLDKDRQLHGCPEWQIHPTFSGH